jgi:hypothetical protein
MKIVLTLFFIGMLGFVSTSWADDFEPMNADSITKTNNDTAPVVVNTVPAATPTETPVPVVISSWVFQLNAETGFPTGHLNSIADQGWGAVASVGYRFPQNITLSFEAGYVAYPARSGVLNTTWGMAPILLKGQYNFSTGPVQPYVFLGAGLALNAQSSSFAGSTYAASENDFLGEAGAGISFLVMAQIYLFIQSDVQLDNTSSGYAPDQPTVIIPLDIGFNFLAD